MTTSLKRRPLTEIVLGTLGTLDWPVGDGAMPSSGGWQGQPNAAGTNFTPYLVLMVGGATTSSGPFTDTQSDWQLGYNIWSFGVRRDQCEAMADVSRDALSSIERTTHTLGSEQYSIQQVRTESIGSINRYDQTDPPYWGEMDSLSIWITKEL